MRGLADRVAKTIARLGVLGWFRGVEVRGIERLGEGPAVVVANHPGGFVDPTLLTAVLPRIPRFLAMARLWRIWPIRPFLALAGAIPVQRAQDGPTGRNVDAFAAAHRVLAEGGVVAIFPEGEASDSPHLLPLKTGAARIALGAAAAGVRGTRIVPIGLIYEQKQTARARAYVRVGEVLDLDARLAALVGTGPPDPGDHEAVGRLTAELEEGLADAALDFEDAAQAADLGYAAVVSLRRPGGSPAWSPSLSATDTIASALAAAPLPAQDRVRAAVADYRGALEANQVSDRQVAAGPRSVARTSRALGGLLALLAVPFALVGLVVNLVPSLAVHLAGRRPAPPVTLATTKFLVGLVTFPAGWLAWRYLMLEETSNPWLLTVAVGPVCGLIAAVLGHRLHRARLARLRPTRLILPMRAAEDLAERRAVLVAAVERALDEAPVGGRGPHAAGSLGDRP
ncbi:MAG TPA: 1-acyl-sn-glycerol-3-phosphate acyltransferase [Actinomycetota bacterium]